MHPEPSPIAPRSSSIRPRFRPSALLLALTGTALAGALLIALPLSAPLSAQTTHADIASASRAFAGDAPALRALQQGRVDDAQSLLAASLALNPADATAHQLLCRVFYAQNSADAAIAQCELAVANDPNNSDHHLWLARAYGMKARHAGPITGFSLARRVHAHFETAVRLDPSNVAALNDLGEYYVDAPFIVGGGAGKAQALAARILPRFPTTAHRILAMLAESNNDLTTAESEFKQAVEARHSPGTRGLAEAWIDLAAFYQRHNRPGDALAAVRSAIAADPAHDAVLVDAASILTSANLDPALAERCLRDYLASPAQSDAAPAFKVHLKLSRLLAARGDDAGATREAAAAAALAPAFAPTAPRAASPVHGS